MLSPSAGGPYERGVPRPAKSAFLVAQRITREIARNGVGVGDLLPPERVMVEQYGTSRTTLREALRLLEFHGLIVQGFGRRGGPVVLDPDPSHLAGTLVLIMALEREPLRTIAEACTAMEAALGRLAARKIGDEALRSLGDALEEMGAQVDEGDAFLATCTRFRVIVAEAAGNPLLNHVGQSLRFVIDMAMPLSACPPATAEVLLRSHSQVYAAVVARDAEAAEAETRECLRRYLRYAERERPDVLDRVFPWDRTLPSNSAGQGQE